MHRRRRHFVEAEAGAVAARDSEAVAERPDPLEQADDVGGGILAIAAQHAPGTRRRGAEEDEPGACLVVEQIAAEPLRPCLDREAEPLSFDADEAEAVRPDARRRESEGDEAAEISARRRRGAGEAGAWIDQ